MSRFSEITPIDFVKPNRTVERVFLHCSASDRPGDDNPEVIERWHLNRGFLQIGYHFYIDKKGAIWSCRPLEDIPAAQSGHNTDSIAICCGGLDEFPISQLKMLKELCSEINSAYKGRVTFHGHREVNPNKTCPVYDYKRLLHLKDDGTMPLEGGES